VNPLAKKELTRLWNYRRDIAGAAVYWSGLGRAYEFAFHPSGAIILMYHSIAGAEAANFIDHPNRIAPNLFDRQMCFLSRHRKVVSLSQLVSDISSGRTPPAGTVCITFDDGYLDNLTVAAPILQSYGLTATLYLATGYVERAETQWADVLYWMLAYRTVEVLTVPAIGLPETTLASRAVRSHVRNLLHKKLLESQREERVCLLAEVRDRLRPEGQPPRLTMNWDEARELVRRYPFIEIGGHTRDHIDLRTHRADVARLQISGCADDLKRELGQRPEHFSFPYSRWCEETRDMVVTGDWRSAMGQTDGIRISSSSDRYVLPRVESLGSMSALRFKSGGAFPGALSILGLP
jgi:peptidoglycan/xylan/chitin deacetylase (PgdA/CDA1 family)